MDNGHPQTTDSQILRQFIRGDTQQMIDGFNNMLKGKFKTPVQIPMAISNVVSWRQEGINYSKNEIFMDILETIDVLQDFNSQVIKSQIQGTVQVKSQLSGMPECKLGLNDRFLQDLLSSHSGDNSSNNFGDIKFHQCVRLSNF